MRFKSMSSVMFRAVAIIALIAVSVLNFNVGRASTPSSGTVDGSKAVQWDFAPVVQSQPTDVGLAATCPPGACDNYDLNVSLGKHKYPGETATLTIKYTWNANDPGSTTAGTDMDLFAIEPDGTTQHGPGQPDVQAHGPGEEDLVLANPRAGVWHIRSLCAQCTNAVPAHGVATLKFGKALPVPNPPSPLKGAPTYKNYTPQDPSLGRDAGEPSIGVNWDTGRAMFQSYNHTLRVTFKSDGTSFWEDKTAPNQPTSLDPILFTDLQTRRTFNSQLISPVGYTTSCSLSAFTDTEGDSWIPSDGCSKPAGSDHQTIGGGPYSPTSCCVQSGTTTGYPNAVYYCSQTIPTPVGPQTTALCGRSDDGGLTYGPGVPVYTSECGGIHGHIRVGPDGTAYLPNHACGGKQGVAVSRNGDSLPSDWQVKTIPDSTANTSSGDPSVAAGSDNTVYYAYVNGGNGPTFGHPMVAVSRTHGDTWSRSIDVGNLGRDAHGHTYQIQRTEFPAVIAGDGDRASVAFLGTTTTGDEQAPNFGCYPTGTTAFSCPEGLWHMFVATTYNRGATWVTVDVTRTDPVQHGCIWNQGGSNPCRNLLDFNDITLDKKGMVLVGYADGCIGPCATPGNQTSCTFSSDQSNYCASLATIAYQRTGKGLFKAYDPPAVRPPHPTRPDAPHLKAEQKNDKAPIVLTWNQPNDHGSPITDYKVYRSTAPNAETLYADVGLSTTFADNNVNMKDTYYYKVRAFNEAGGSPFSNEVHIKPR